MRSSRTLIMILLLTAHEFNWAGFDEGVTAFERGDHAAAEREFRALAEQGDAKAQTLLGAMYEGGVGVQQDYTEALKWYRSGAEQGLAEAQFDLGKMYFIGKGVSVNYMEARKWLRKSAEQNFPDAQFTLGWMYDLGYIKTDYKKAIKWYRKAAEQGHPDAQLHLGYKYSSGQGVPEDDKEALKWYMKAADQGHAEAQFVLGQCYQAGGGGISQDYVQAFKWYSIAVNSWLNVVGSNDVMESIGIRGALGGKKAIENLEHIASEMTPDQLAEAKKLAQEWIDQHE